MTSEWQSVELGAQGLAYIRNRLELGKTFARYLLDNDLSSARILTMLPRSVSPRAALNLETGILAAPPSESHIPFVDKTGRKGRLVPKPNMDPALIDLVRNYLSVGNRRVMIFEDALARPTDPWFLKSPGHFLSFDNEILHIVAEEDAMNEQAIGDTIKRSRSWLFIGAMTSFPERLRVADRVTKIDDSLLRALAKSSKGIVVGAYDGEGFVVWENAEFER
jgi:hypothetical protein